MGRDEKTLRKPLRLDSVLLPVRGARLLAGILFVGAVALPWLAKWQGVIQEKREGGTDVPPREVVLRPEMVELPGGIFVMGSPRTEVGRAEDEKRHEMAVLPFAISRTEVTQKQWKEVMGTTPFDCAYGCGDAYPAQNVSWQQAIQFMNKLTDRENLHHGNNAPLTRCYEETKWTWDRTCTGYRLPTEAEWEYAARAGTETVYSFGDDPKKGCEYGNGKWEGCDDGFEKLAPVGTFKPNPWGLYDVHGNVLEWVWDKFAAYPEKASKGYAGPDSDTDIVAIDGIVRRVLRGGSFSEVPRRLRSSDRRSGGPTLTYGGGFRCARGASPALIP